ncbi:MAG: hypothetical protein DSY90_15000 [Deltaproteobacteria bacterium]|nr:MAG: hypothetical protein DSY90_15000 [Deltaproteobacteria bacterium]
MAAENTHLYLADQMKGKIGDKALKRIISDHVDYFYLGSIFPDILYYSRDKQISKVAYSLHGEDGVPTNEIVFQLLNTVKSKNDKKNFTFIAGFLTHYAVDITFHPVILYISGYKTDGNKQEQDRSSYLHWHYEADINRQINHQLQLDKTIKPELIQNLVLPGILGIGRSVIVKALKRQIRYFSILPGRGYYFIFKVLYNLGLYPAGAIAGFDHNLKKESLRLPDPIAYKDLFTGVPLQTTLNALIARAVQRGCRMIETAYAYHIEEKSRDECQEIIAGQSLVTGQVGKTTADIRFSARLL